jgi:anti-sigma B factor antagonist
VLVDEGVENAARQGLGEPRCDTFVQWPSFEELAGDLEMVIVPLKGDDESALGCRARTDQGEAELLDGELQGLQLVDRDVHPHRDVTDVEASCREEVRCCRDGELHVLCHVCSLGALSAPLPASDAASYTAAAILRCRADPLENRQLASRGGPTRGFEGSVDIDVEVTRSPTYVVVRVGGVVDLATAPELHKVLSELAGTTSSVVIDLGNVDFVDSSGLSVLVAVGDLLSEATPGSTVRLVVTRPIIRQALEITGLTQLFDTFESVDDAVKGM